MVSRFEWEGYAPHHRNKEDGTHRQQQLEHLLKVALNVSKDANRTWAAVWDEMKHLVTPNGLVLPEAKEGFVPACGWPEFFEKLWLLKRYLDSAQRICAERP